MPKPSRPAVSPDLTARLRAWSYRRQLLGRTASDPQEALRRVVGVYSSHPTAPLALASRVDGLDAVRFADLERARAAIRLPAMRLSIFLLPTETAPYIFAATRQPLQKRVKNLQYAGLDWDEYARLKPLILRQAQEPATAASLQWAVATDGRLMTAVRFMSYEGLLLRLGTSLRADSLRYVATDSWLGHPLEDADPIAALAWLADAYLRGYGPARVADFAWWAGVARRNAAAALRRDGIVDVGSGLFLPEDQRDAFEQAEPLDPDAVNVLPKWDPYTMGYALDGRQRLIDDVHLDQIYGLGKFRTGATSGDGSPLVLRGGRAVALWSHRFEKDRLLVRVSPFQPHTLPRRLYERAFEEAARLLGASGVDVAQDDGPSDGGRAPSGHGDARADATGGFSI
ncbi:MAG: winged helix DNA-binding domain-containing protein [Chloroflexi bacterium]|nr:winged helix DNA-binding domain-containing protein [Chloroflexota bacterium]